MQYLNYSVVQIYYTHISNYRRKAQHILMQVYKAEHILVQGQLYFNTSQFQAGKIE